MKRLLAAVLILAFAVSLPVPALAYPQYGFRDAMLWNYQLHPSPRKGNAFGWVVPELERATTWEIVLGYPTGTMPFCVEAKPKTYECVRSVEVDLRPEFRPAAPISRAEFAALLARMAYLEDVEGGAGAALGVAPDRWYSPYVAGLAAAGVIRSTDYPDGFDPDGQITRMELAAWTVRAAVAYGLPAVSADLSAFADGDAVPGHWASDLAAAVGMEIVHGYPDGTIRPGASANRAEATAMLMRLLPRLSAHPPDGAALSQFALEALREHAKIGMEMSDRGRAWKAAGEQNKAINYVLAHQAELRARMAPYLSDTALRWVHYNTGELQVGTRAWFQFAINALDDYRQQGMNLGLRDLQVLAVEPELLYDNFALLQVRFLQTVVVTKDPLTKERRLRVWLKRTPAGWRLTDVSWPIDSE